MLTAVHTVASMNWRMRLQILADAVVAGVQAMRRPDPAAEAARVEREANALADATILRERSRQSAPHERSPR